MGNQNSSGVFSPEMSYRIGGTRSGSETFRNHSDASFSNNQPFVDNVYVFETPQGVAATNNIPFHSSERTYRGQRSVSRANLVLEGQPPSNQQLPSQQQPVIRCGAKQTNLVNLQKNSLKLVKDEATNLYMLRFLFDSIANGTLTVYYFAVDRTNYENFGSISIETTGYKEPLTMHFSPGTNILFEQDSQDGIDLQPYSEEDISHPRDNCYPLIIVLKVDSVPEDGDCHQVADVSSQITFATFSKKEDSTTEYVVSVVQQYAQVGDSLYMLEDIYGYESTMLEESVEDPNLCVICMLNETDTLLLPCRHLCMCAECADRLRVRSNKCPVCRQTVEWMLQIENLTNS
ncbi:hypothetical protein GAYE_SCF05G2597 [Galdieria yellowstonensis]|uniref:RING-type E3 ubiquitin transferase n=1 Tax=Galdieria yellowstonensis TaxID=3028027 RepID=A0AAV9IBB9_9RHOD|nr:hypothetical protein GAYE_SCF05G2597 [Galdieria yellowstonensis]